MPNITRNAIVNCAELVTYDLIKETILKYDLMTGEMKKTQMIAGTTDIHVVLKTSKISTIAVGSDVASVSLQTTCHVTSRLPLLQASAQQLWHPLWM